MPSPTVDRRFGLVGNAAVKAPVAAVATSNITLSGQQTIDGVALLAVNTSGVADRVLLTAQTDSSQNGIWDVSTGAWTRSIDADGTYDLVQGSTLLVNSGSSNAGTYWRLVTSGIISIGTTLMSWTKALTNPLSALTFLQAGTGAVTRGAQDKVREIVSVTDFGATGDGSTDDTAAVSAALTYANTSGTGVQPKTLYFPPGTYMITPGGLPDVICDIDGPRAALVARTNALATLLRIGYVSTLVFQRIRLLELRGFNVTYSAGATRYGYGLGFNAAAGQFIAQLQVDIQAINGFVIGVNCDCTPGFHIGSNVFRFNSVGWSTTGILGKAGALEFENNRFEITYSAGCNTVVSLGAPGVANCLQNYFYISALELHLVAGTTGFSLLNVNTHQNIFRVDNLVWNANTTWVVHTDGTPYSNVYQLPALDVTLLSMGPDIIITHDGPGLLNDSGRGTAARTRLVGQSAAQPTFNSVQGDRYFTNTPASFGVASWLKNDIAWGPETSAGNKVKTAFTPSVAPASGSLTTYSSSGQYSIWNGILYFRLTIAITTNGTAAGNLGVINMPVAATEIGMCVGRGDGVSGKELQAKMAVGSSLAIYNYDGTYPGANGESLIVSGWYFIN